MPDASFPMHVLPVNRVLKLKRLPTHEAVKANLVLYREGMSVLFVSQTWLSNAHPDNPSNIKLGLLQHFLRDARTGKQAIEPDWLSELRWGRLEISAKQIKQIEFVWFDIFSVPQQDRALQAKAIASIPAYVANSAFFLCIAGPWHHENGSSRDVRAWLSRGWCRVEVLCNALSPQAKPLIVMQSRSYKCTYGPSGFPTREWATWPVGLGNFTVDSDRLALGPVLEGLIDERMAAKKAEGNEESMRWFRFLHAIKGWLLKGTGVEVAPILTLDAWLERLGFSSASDVDSHGWGPLRYALYEGRVDLAKALLDAGCDVEGRLLAGFNPLGVGAGTSHLMAASHHGESNVEMIQLLLAAGADPLYRAVPLPGQVLPLCQKVCMHGITPDIEAILAAAPQATDERNTFGMRAFGGLVQQCHPAATKHFLETRPELFAEVHTGCPNGWISLAVSLLGDVDTIRHLITHGCDIDYFDVEMATAGFRQFIEESKTAILQCDYKKARRRGPGKLAEAVALGHGTALHLAAFFGNLAVVEMLLQARANVASTNQLLLMTPLHLAAYDGHEEVCVRLLQAGAPKAALDALKRTPATWAKLRGYKQLAKLISKHTAVKELAASAGGIVQAARGEESKGDENPLAA